MWYIPNSDKEVAREMLSEIRADSVAELFSDVPERILLDKPPEIGDPLDEIHLERLSATYLSKNTTSADSLSFLGAGIWDNHVPAVIDEIASKQGFYTGYTPYQPEASQGALQAIFEYQSLICELTGMEVASASLYDWSTALAEAALMAIRITHGSKLVVSEAISPERLDVLTTYARPIGAKIETIPFDPDKAWIELDALEGSVDDQTAMVYLENPNFFGVIDENATEAAEIVHRRDSLLVVGVDPISLGLLKPPGEYGADVVVGEGQALGSYPSFGGPLLGILATRFDRRLVTQMPGRLVGMTWSNKNVRGYVITLQTREQHIRRERATSNITTNESLMAIRAAAYVSLLGPSGLKSLCRKVLLNTNYLIKGIGSIPGLQAPVFDSAHFREFLVRSRGRTWSEMNSRLLKAGIFGGLDLKTFRPAFPGLDEVALFATTERHERQDLDVLIRALGEVVA